MLKKGLQPRQLISSGSKLGLLYSFAQLIVVSSLNLSSLFFVAIKAGQEAQSKPQKDIFFIRKINTLPGENPPTIVKIVTDCSVETRVNNPFKLVGNLYILKI